MHPTNLRDKYENMIRDNILVLGSDISDSIEFSLCLDGTAEYPFAASLYIRLYDGQIIGAHPALEIPLPSREEVTELVSATLDSIREAIKSSESESAA